MTDNETGLARVEQVPQDGIVMPMSEDKLVLQMEAFNKTKGMILKDSDYQQISGKTFIKKSGWRRLAVAFKLSTEIKSTDITRNDNGVIIAADVIARAFSLNGVSREAYGGCDNKERSFSKGQDIVATAQTRAVNRAISDLVAGGEVTADEMSDGRHYQPSVKQSPTNTPQTASRPAQQQDNYNRDSNPNVYDERTQRWQVMLFGNVEFPWKNDKGYDVVPIMPSNTNEKLVWAQKPASDGQRKLLQITLCEKGYADDAQRRQLYQMFYRCFGLTKDDYAKVLSSKVFTAGIMSCFIELAIGLIGKNENDPVPWSANAQATQTTMPEPEQIHPTQIPQDGNDDDISLDEDIPMDEGDDFL